MTITAPVSETQTFTITEEIAVAASLEQTFRSLVAQMGRLNETPDGAPLPMVLELHPGGRWYRDLGGDNGHLWGFVQSIKRPTLLEIWGPLFMSTAATSTAPSGAVPRATWGPTLRPLPRSAARNVAAAPAAGSGRKPKPVGARPSSARAR